MLLKTALISALLSLALCIPVTKNLETDSLVSNEMPWEQMHSLLVCQDVLNELAAAHEECTLEKQFNIAVEMLLEVFNSAPFETKLIWSKLLAIARDPPINKTKSLLSGKPITPTEAKKFLILDMQNFYYVDGLSDFGLSNHNTVHSKARKKNIAIENRISGNFLDCASCVNFEANENKQASDYFKAELDLYNAAPKVSEADLVPSKSSNHKRKRVQEDDKIEASDNFLAELDYNDAAPELSEADLPPSKSSYFLADLDQFNATPSVPGGAGSLQRNSLDLKSPKKFTAEEINHEKKISSASD